MTKSKMYLNQKYERLCAQVGDLEFKKSQIERTLKDLYFQIKLFNDMQPHLETIEALESSDEE